MNVSVQQVVKDAAERCGHDRTRMIDLVRYVQARTGSVSDEAIDLIASEMKVPRVDVAGVVTFYAFLSNRQLGRTVIRLSECPSCRGAEGHATAAAFQKTLGIGFGETTSDGQFSLEKTACIGMCDQGPAALVGGLLLGGIVPERVSALLDAARANELPGAGFDPVDNIRKAGEVVLAGMESGAGLKRALSLTPEQVIAEINGSKLRGRGGAGFPAGSKMDFARKAAGERKIIICNADEGEPGTFKDRVILKSFPEAVFEGMAICGHAVGASEGILYLRGEYEFLLTNLEKTLEGLRKKGVLGNDAGGKAGFHFDIRIQMGAGAYICGEESALISSCEGLRGVPKTRPPFPVEKGYLGLPTMVNNVETFCCVARVMEKGAAWFSVLGTKESSGTKLFSVSGDCKLPGIWELPFGVTLETLLKEVGGEDAQAVLVGGPSGNFVEPASFGRRLCFEDLPTGGSIMVFGRGRDLLQIVSEFMQFFVEESCGFCTPCRVGNVLIKDRLDQIRDGRGLPDDLVYLDELCDTVKKMSRCGLGQTSPNPVSTTLSRFRSLYEAKLRAGSNGIAPKFDIHAAVAEAARVQGRAPIFNE